MIENGRITGLGAAYVDAKIQSSVLHLPSERNKLPEFLDAHPEADLYAGGSIPNILTAYVRLASNPNVRLLSCVGDDARGRFFAEHTDIRLGEPQVSARNPTGVWVGIYDDKGKLTEDSDFYGAAGDITVSKKELEDIRNDVFITDIDACRVTETLNSIGQILATISDKGLFVLSLSGVGSPEDVYKPLTFFNRVPQVVFGNAFELSCITNNADVNQSIKTTFPNSRLVVITQGEFGSLVKFREQFFSVPTPYIPKEKIIDTNGAGDSYMGTMLGVLSHTKFLDWTKYDVIVAARVSSYASTLVLQSPQARLTSEMAQNVLDFIKHL